jgi:protein-L-isoaspartate(D-aspartate) O-methyltransferase
MNGEHHELISENIIQELIQSGYLRTPRIIEAFRLIDRRHFVPPDRMHEAYGNYPLPIGYGQTISQPLTVAFMLELLAPESGDVILEIGAGSGWQTALLACLVGREGRVISVELIPELCKLAHAHVGKYDYVRSGVVDIVLGDGSQGAPPKFIPPGGFDRIISAASAARKIPEPWKVELRAGGRIVAPLRDRIVMLDKTGEMEFTMEEYVGFSFVPLIEEE